MAILITYLVSNMGQSIKPFLCETMKQTIAFVFLLLPLSAAFGSNSGLLDSLRHIPTEKHFEAFTAVCGQQVYGMDSTSAVEWFVDMEKKSYKARLHALEASAAYYHGLYLISLGKTISGGAQEHFLRAIELAELYQLPHLHAYFTFSLGHELYKQNQREEGLIHLLNGLNKMMAAGLDKVPNVALALFTMGEVYFDFDNYEKAAEYYEIALSHAEDDYRIQLGALNKLAATATETGDFEKAETYFGKGLDLTFSKQDSIGMAMVCGNMGVLYLDMDRKAEADSLLRFSYELATRLKSPRTALSCLLRLITTEEEAGNLEMASLHIAGAREILQAYPMPPEAWLAFYEACGDLAFNTGNFQGAALFRDSAFLMIDSISNARNANILANLNAQVAAARYEAHLQVLEKEKELQKIIRNGISALAVILVSILGLMLLSLIRKRKIEHSRYQQEKEDAEKKLMLFRSNIRQKNDMIEYFKQRMEALDEHRELRTEEEIHQKLHQATILTEDDWSEFKQLFEKVHPNFISHLQVTYPDLTISEIRLLVLLKLNLSVHEIGGMLGILPHSVRKTRSRLMKKLKLEDHKMLPVFLEGATKDEPLEKLSS